MGINEDELEFYGKYKAKLSDELSARVENNPDGKLIWGNKTLNGGKGFYGSLAGMSICPTSDGGAIFAYMYIGAENGVNIEKLDKDGNTVWTEQLLDPEGMTSYSYPYLVDIDILDYFHLLH